MPTIHVYRELLAPRLNMTRDLYAKQRGLKVLHCRLQNPPPFRGLPAGLEDAGAGADANQHADIVARNSSKELNLEGVT